MKRLLILGIAVAVAITAAVSIAAYGGGGGDDSSAPAEPMTSPAANAVTVSTQEIGDEGAVLVDSEGRALYTADQEIAAGNMVLCTEACTSFWEPLTLDSGSPTGSSVPGELGIVERPDGSRQVVLDGKLLYSFVEDEPGEVTGDGFEDAFDGQTLTWHVVHANGSTGSPGSDTTGTGPLGY
jgi:predicted lipoprotein with Yx(FWY)xxD motif